MSGVPRAVPPAELTEYRGMLARFRAVVLDWRLSPTEVCALLGLPPRAHTHLGRAGSVSVAAETRMRRTVEVAGLVRDVLGGVADCRAWLRRPNPGIIGHLLPLDVMCDGGDGLRLLRDALRGEAAQAREGAAWTRL